MRAVLWNVYGTLLAIPGGDLAFEHPQPFVMSSALDKTIQEFNTRNEINVIYNFVNCDVYKRTPEIYAKRHEFAADNEKLLVHLSNFRPVKP